MSSMDQPGWAALRNPDRRAWKTTHNCHAVRWSQGLRSDSTKWRRSIVVDGFADDAVWPLALDLARQPPGWVGNIYIILVGFPIMRNLGCFPKMTSRTSDGSKLYDNGRADVESPWSVQDTVLMLDCRRCWRNWTPPGCSVCDVEVVAVAVAACCMMEPDALASDKSVEGSAISWIKLCSHESLSLSAYMMSAVDLQLDVERWATARIRGTIPPSKVWLAPECASRNQVVIQTRFVCHPDSHPAKRSVQRTLVTAPEHTLWFWFNNYLMTVCGESIILECSGMTRLVHRCPTADPRRQPIHLRWACDSQHTRTCWTLGLVDPNCLRPSNQCIFWFFLITLFNSHSSIRRVSQLWNTYR